MKPCPFTNAKTSLSRRAPVSVSFLALFLLAGPTLFAGCSDDGKLLGSDGGAGSASQASAGSSASGSGQASAGSSSGQASGGSSSSNTAGSGQAGMITNSGAPGGGTTSGAAGSAGKTSTGGTCAIPEGCQTAGGQGSGGQGSSDCAGITCTPSQTCVAYRTVGGAIMEPDTQGKCMTGTHLENLGRCQYDFAYACTELTGCSAPAATCHCAPNTQCANDGNCKLPTPAAWLDPSADLVCEQLVP